MRPTFDRIIPRYGFFMAVALLLNACTSQKPSADKGCPAIPCTMEFKMITVKIISTSGAEVSFKEHKIIDTSTGKEVNVKSELPVTNDNANTLVIADDSQIRNYTEQGTELQLQIKRKDDKMVKVNYKIAGGKCACHVSKLEGPDQVNIDQL
jgi:hypothetical protein